ncbi:MAG: Gfo/Idh/MocA family oxidoreductase [bacterium]|nr:Gfo/Idh/MocA family oxidoreductase [bacterium]
MTYSIALIGCGRVGVWLEDDPLRGKPATHMGGIQKILQTRSPGKGREKPLELNAICDIDEERLQKCKERWNIPNTYTDYKELIDKEKPGIVIIATWTSSHHEIAVYAAQNGVKGIVLEKPLATTLKLAREIIHTCNRCNVKLVVNHERRWDPLYRKTREIVESNELGPLKLIYGNVLCRSAPRGSWKALLKEVGGGPLLHDGTHLIDMVRYFCGDILSINGSVKREDPAIGVETTATALLTTQNGVNVFLEAGGMRNYFNFELDLQFENGRIKIGNGIREFHTTQTSKRYTGFRDLVKKDFPPFKRDSDPFTGAILEVIRAIENDREPFSSGNDGFKAMEIIFGIYYSAYLKGKTVTLPLKISGHPLKKMFRDRMI